MDCMTRLIVSPPEPGQYDVVNQVSGLYKIADLAETVAEVGKEFGLDVEIERLDNPRVEAEEHPFEVVSEKLPGTFGFHPITTLAEEIRSTSRDPATAGSEKAHGHAEDALVRRKARFRRAGSLRAGHQEDGRLRGNANYR